MYRIIIVPLIALIAATVAACGSTSPSSTPKQGDVCANVGDTKCAGSVQYSCDGPQS